MARWTPSRGPRPMMCRPLEVSRPSHGRLTQCQGGPMVFRRLFSSQPEPEPEPETDLVPRPAAPADTDTETIRRIAAQLQELPMERRKFIGGFAYVLGRAAHADLAITPDEIAAIEQTVMEVG